MFGVNWVVFHIEFFISIFLLCYCPLSENGDDNLILGFGIDKVSLYEKIEVQVGVEYKELSPLCVLFCLTCEGKLIMYHVAR